MAIDLSEETIWRFAIILLGYILTLALSGVFVRHFTQSSSPVADADKPKPTSQKPKYDPSIVIGKCENLLAVTFILTNQVMGLALIFAAKSLVRRDAIEKDAGYYLGGTFVNLTWSVLMGYLTRLALDFTSLALEG